MLLNRRFIKAEGTHHFALYLPEADVDGDGLPDGGAPLATFDMTTVDTRLSIGF